MSDPGPLPTPVVLHPAPTSAGRCPRDGGELRVVRLHLPGWRVAVEGDCPTCGHRYVQDLPSGHGLMNPATLDLDTGETIDPWGAAWFSSRLTSTWEWPDADPVAFEPERRARGGKAVLLDCLDPIYGHALLKLLSAARLADQATVSTSVVLLPRSLAHLVPAEVDERWIVDEEIRRLGSWLLGLDESLHTELKRFDEVRLAAAPVQPHPSTVDLDRFVGSVETERPGNPSIALSLRDDRRWGKNARDEAGRVSELTERLSAAYPDVAIAAVGPGTPGGLPEAVRDLRSSAPALEEEESWLRVLRGADLAVGVHGSNMLLPSALARAVIELLPRGRYGNLFQATIVRQADPVLALDRHRTLYGDERLADLSGDRVADLAVILLDGLDRFEAHSTGPAAGIGSELPGPIPAGPSRRIPDPRQRPAERAHRIGRRLLSSFRSLVARAAGGSPRTRVDDVLDSLSVGDPASTLRIDATRNDPLGVLDLAGAALGHARAVIVTGLSDAPGEPPRSRQLVERLEAAGLQIYTSDGERLVRVQLTGPLREPRLLVALADGFEDRRTGR